MDCGCGCGCGCGGVAIAFYTSAVQMKKKSEKSGGKGEREWRACETTGEPCASAAGHKNALHLITCISQFFFFLVRVVCTALLLLLLGICNDSCF